MIYYLNFNETSQSKKVRERNSKIYTFQYSVTWSFNILPFLYDLMVIFFKESNFIVFDETGHHWKKWPLGLTLFILVYVFALH